MASYEKRGKNWRVQVKRGDYRISATFPTKAEAQDWAIIQESEIRHRKHGAIPNKTLGDLLDRYQEEVSPTKKGEAWEVKRIRVLKGYDIAKVKLSDLDGTHVSTWRNKRSQDVSSASVARDWNLLSHACTVAVKEWKWLHANPFREVQRPKDSAPRQRVFTDDEIERICFALGWDIDQCSTEQVIDIPVKYLISQRVALAFLFALETGCRAGEIVSLIPDRIYPRHVHIPGDLSKNERPRDVPLSHKAREILDLVPEGFGLRSEQLGALFRKAKKRAGCDDAHFHDSRRTALTKLAKVFTNPLDLARVSGHKDLSMLIRVYYAPSVEDLADKLAQ